jgi:hypothetical protein
MAAIDIPGEDRFAPFVTSVAPDGTYRYYCTIHAKYVPDTDQVAGLPTAGFPDEPMEGLITAG